MPEAIHTAKIAIRREQLKGLLAPLAADVRELTIEIGAGHGHFLTAYAQHHPEKLCVGVDIKLDRVRRAERKRERSGLTNLQFVRADAEDFLAALPEEDRFTEVFILYPDPWPKRRHHKNRLLREEFLRGLGERARPGARLYFRTDHIDYFTAAREEISEEGAWKIVDEAWPFEFATVFQLKAPTYYSLVATRSG